jgi:tetratricopeptide (TPR) repeat protein
MEHAKAGAFEDAVDCYQRAIEADPDFCYAYYHLARAYEQRDETDAAIETLQAGRRRAEALRDEQALSEIDAYLEQLQ